MRFIRQHTAIGMPFHGLAVNNILAKPGGDKTICDPALSRTMQTVGQCVPVRHPQAQGATRNATQQANDAAAGMEWRDYALLCGPGRHINGGPALGTMQWLYCDPGGPTWIIRLDGVKAGGTITFDVWIEAIFGRLGRARAFTAQKIGTLAWSPDIPSWYGGGYTQADVVAAIDLDWINTLAFSQDGAECYINIFSFDQGINEDVYQETTPSGRKGDWNVFSALVGVAKVAISGSGDLGANGAGISANVTAELDYEGGIVTSRIGSSGGGGFIDMPCAFIDVSAVQDWPPYPGDGFPPDCIEDTGTTTYSASLKNDDVTGKGPVDSREGITAQHTAILYRTPDGDVVREFDYYVGRENWAVTVSGGFVEIHDLTNCAGGPSWGIAGMTPTGAPIVGDYTTWTRDGYSVKVTVCGTVVTDVGYERVVQRDGFWECANTQSMPDGIWLDSGRDSPYWTETASTTINGVETSPGTDIFAAHEVRQLAQNLHYVATYLSQADNESTRDLDEHVVGISDTGNASIVWSGTSIDTYRPGSSAMPDLPNLREIVWSYQPVTGEFIHGPRTLFVLYSGDVYQYC